MGTVHLLCVRARATYCLPGKSQTMNQRIPRWNPSSTRDERAVKPGASLYISLHDSVSSSLENGAHWEHTCLLRLLYLMS